MKAWALVENVAFDFGPAPVPRPGQGRACRPTSVVASWASVEEVAFDFGPPRRPSSPADPRLWRRRYKGPITREDEREIQRNLEGFFSLLDEWAA